MPAVLERSELEASPLADLHAIADQLGLDSFRRLRKADLIDRILGEQSEDADDDGATSEEESSGGARKRSRRGGRSRRSRGSADAEADGDSDSQEAAEEPEASTDDRDADEESPRKRSRRGGRSRRSSAESNGKADDAGEGESRDGGEVAEGIVEVLGNGSAFLRIDPPEPSDGDVYISAAQVRRCELVSGDRVTGPVRTPRRSERYPSLVRIDTINGGSADAVSSGTRYEDLPVAYPGERFELKSSDQTLQAIEALTPFGRGSRVTIVGAARSGKSETLGALLHAIAAGKGPEVSLVLAGARPEEIGRWQEGEPAPVAALSFAASPDTQAQAVDHAIDAGKRVAARGGDAVVLIDSLDGLPPHVARRALAAARNLREGGSLTVIATASAPVGGESTVIALDVALTSTGRQPILDLAASGVIRPDLLVGESDAKALVKARAEALDNGS
ncbi:MAG TPA: Rho termination factor N-terminal domain-containing protein [Solirubrobacteraceae bacterium]|nr:Rho termination factor N-terminal domain-containing protein [Solirubrobacteraceae bacterium]